MNTSQESLKEIAARIREMRAISGFSIEKMAGLTDTTPAAYAEIEAGKSDPPFSSFHKCAIAFGMDIMTLLEGHSAKLSHFPGEPRGDRSRYGQRAGHSHPQHGGDVQGSSGNAVFRDV